MGDDDHHQRAARIALALVMARAFRSTTKEDHMMTFWIAAGVAIVAFSWGSRWGHARARVERDLHWIQQQNAGLTAEFPAVIVERRDSVWPNDD